MSNDSSKVSYGTSNGAILVELRLCEFDLTWHILTYMNLWTMELLGIRASPLLWPTIATLPRHLDIAQVSVFSMGLGSCIFHQAGPEGDFKCEILVTSKYLQGWMELLHILKNSQGFSSLGTSNFSIFECIITWYLFLWLFCIAACICFEPDDWSVSFYHADCGGDATCAEPHAYRL